MSNKFNVGTKVQSRNKPDVKGTVIGMNVNPSSGDVTLIIDFGCHPVTCSVYDVEPTFKNMYFKVESPEHSRAIQSWLFEQGYKWVSALNNFPKATDGVALYCFANGDIKGAHAYGVKDHQEHTLSYEVETKYKITDVSPVEKKELVELNGKMYDKEVLEKALSGLEEAKE